MERAEDLINKKKKIWTLFLTRQGSVFVYCEHKYWILGKI